jgi:ubiquinone/menaquinone biosynthesis C-methylase UbiE
MSDEEYWEGSIPWSYRDVSPKPTYEERRKARYELQDYMKSVIPFADFKDKRVLEVGSGSGIDAAEFARNGAIVTAVDMTNSAVNETERTLAEAGLTARVQKAEADDLPFRGNSFDLVYSFGVLHHIRDVASALMEFRRVLKRGGLVIAMVYHVDSLLYAYSIMHLGLPFERMGNPPHVKAYTKQEAFRLFDKWFLDPEIQVRYNVVDLRGRRKVKLNIPDDLELGWHIIIKAKK